MLCSDDKVQSARVKQMKKQSQKCKVCKYRFIESVRMIVLMAAVFIECLPGAR